MTDHPAEPPLPPEPLIEPPRRWRLSMIWVVPLLAAVIGLSLVAQALWQRGPVITVSLSSAEGIEPGKTKVKYKDVEIGDVQTIHLTTDRTRVVATIELTKEARQFAVADSRFWVVRPRFAGSGISGLGTLLSGAYIGVDAGHSAASRTDFVGLDDPPVVASDIPGRRFRLQAEDIGSLDIGSPVYFRRIEVGHVESFALEADGRHIALGIFIKSPYDRFVTVSGRFWHASGVDLRLDASGVRLETQSLATILMGGIAFEPPVGGAMDVAPEGSEFPLASGHAEAMKAPDGVPETVILRFRQSVRGLTADAPVDFRGVEIGLVRAVRLNFDPGANDYSATVTADIYPERLAPANAAPITREERSRHIANLVRAGLRAQLRTGNLLTGQLFVAVDFFPESPPGHFDPTVQPLELPTVPSDLEELHQQVQSILRKLDKVPFDTLGADAHLAMADAHRTMLGLETGLQRINGLLQRTDSEIMPEIRDSLREMRRTLEATQGAMAADSPLQQDTRQALRGVAEATRSLKALTDNLDRHPESLVRGKKGLDP